MTSGVAPAIRLCPPVGGKTRKSSGEGTGGALAEPGDRERRRRDEERVSNLAEGYRKAAPYMAASTSLVVSVLVFAWVGHWVDRKLGNQVPWFLMLGAVIGMTGGFISFFRTVLRKSK